MQPAGCPLHRASAIAAIELINGAHQLLPSLLLCLTQRHQKMGLEQLGSLQVLHQHPRLRQLSVWSEDAVHQGERCLQQNGGVVAGQIQSDAGGLAVKRGDEGAGAGVHREGGSPLVLLAQFFRGAHHIGGDGLPQFLQGRDRPAEAAAHAGFLFGGRCQRQWQAGMAAQFPLQPQPHHTALRPQFTAGHVPQQAGVVHPPQPAPARQFAADAPDVLDCDGLEPGVGIRAVAQIEDAGMGGDLLGQAIGQFRLAFAGPQADGDRQPQVLAHPGSQGSAPGLQVTILRTTDAPEGFVDGIDLELFAVNLQQAHHPLAHVGVQGVVGTAHHHVLAFQLLTCLEIGGPHRNAEGPGFSTAGHDAAVVVGEHDDGFADQAGVKALFAGGVEVVAVDQGGGKAHVRADGSRGWPPPRSARHRIDAAPGVGKRDWRPPGAGGHGAGPGV